MRRWERLGRGFYSRGWRRMDAGARRWFRPMVVRGLTYGRRSLLTLPCSHHKGRAGTTVVWAWGRARVWDVFVGSWLPSKVGLCQGAGLCVGVDLGRVCYVLGRTGGLARSVAPMVTASKPSTGRCVQAWWCPWCGSGCVSWWFTLSRCAGIGWAQVLINTWPRPSLPLFLFFAKIMWPKGAWMIRLDTLVGGRERLASKVCFWKRRNVLWSKLSKICREKDSSILTKEVYFFQFKRDEKMWCTTSQVWENLRKGLNLLFFFRISKIAEKIYWRF